MFATFFACLVPARSPFTHAAAEQDDAQDDDKPHNQVQPACGRESAQASSIYLDAASSLQVPLPYFRRFSTARAAVSEWRLENCRVRGMSRRGVSKRV
eukprot:355192-Prymnesium_polylepis.1